VDGTVGRHVRLTLPRVIARKAVLVPLLVAAVAGCSGGDPEVVVLPPLPEITARPTPSATPTPDALASAATAATPQGAAAFARYYYEKVVAEALVTLDSGAMRRHSASTCEVCRLQAEAVDRERKTGHRYAGGRIIVRAAEAAPPADGRVAVALVYDAAELRRTDQASPAPTPLAATTGVRLEVTVIRAGEGWKVSAIDPVAPS
jgi:hypothetical protein